MKFEYHQGPSFKADKMRASPTNYELDNERGAARWVVCSLEH